MSIPRARHLWMPAILLVAFAAPAAAKLPMPNYSTVPHVLLLVGRDASGAADPFGDFRVVCRDLANVPTDGVTLTFEFTDCTDARVASDQAPTAVANCPYEIVVASALTAADGSVDVRLVGHADHAAVPATGASLKVFGDGVLLAYVRVAILDQDGGGLGPSDLSLWLDDYFAGTNPARSDYDGDGVVGPADLSIWNQAFFAAGSSLGDGGSTCP